MKTRITLTAYAPAGVITSGILASWRTGTVKQTALFDNLDAVYNYFCGLFWEPVFVDRRRSA